MEKKKESAEFGVHGSVNKNYLIFSSSKYIHKIITLNVGKYISQLMKITELLQSWASRETFSRFKNPLNLLEV